MLSIQTSLRNKRAISYLIGTAFLIFAIILGVSVGTVSIPFQTLIKAFSSSSGLSPATASIVFDIRLPRVLLAGLVGASLSLAGAGFQGLLKNPLADPYTLGVSSGASVGAVLVLFYGISLPVIDSFTLPFVSVIFALITIFLVLMFSRLVHRGISVETIILTGVIFSSFLGSLISLMIALTGEQLRSIISWLLGSVSMRGWEYVWIMLPFFVAGSLMLLLSSVELNALSFGEERAHHLGVNVKSKKLFILVAASILTGASVAVSGTIGFVGLVIPHLLRLLFGPDHRHILPLSIIFGAGFLILADLVARTAISPAELPIGVITALIGAPVFALLLFRQRMERRD